MIAALAVLWAVVATVAARIYYAQRQQVTKDLDDTTKAADRVIATMRDSNVDLASENARLTFALRTIHETITRRPPRRRWLRICHQVARKAAAGHEW